MTKNNPTNVEAAFEILLESNTMVKESLLKADSPRGIWQISDAGRAWLAQQKPPSR